MTSISQKKNITSLKDVKKQDYKDPKCKWDPKIEDEIKKYIRRALSKSDVNIFEDISDYFQTYYDRPCNNMTTLKKRTKNESGFVWEHFCLMYLKSKGYGECWLISEVPVDILNKLNLSRMDMGIDIIIKHNNGFFAVQAKWRSNKNKKSKISLTWNKLSTFYALCARTGPWLKYIVITNCDFVRRQGKKFKMDQTIAKGSFISCKRDIWVDMCGMKQGNKMVELKKSSIDICETIELKQSPELLASVCSVTGRSKSFYKDWDDMCLRHRLEFYEEYENRVNRSVQTLQEKQRGQRSAFLDKMFPTK